MPKLPHVALFVETSRSYGRNILEGVIDYINEHGPWSIYLQPDGLDSPPPHWLKGWRGDGILARINSAKMADAISEAAVPVVDLRFAIPYLGFPAVGIQNRKVVELAFEHLSNNGFTQFAFYGPHHSEVVGIDLRRDFFKQLTVESGFQCHFLDVSNHSFTSWDEEQERIGNWLKQLPKPIGLMASNDSLGQQILDACRRVDVLVPEEVAVIGVDNDELLCRVSRPPLTSVDINTRRVGFEAARLLGKLMAGQNAPDEPLLLPPRCVVARESTNVLATTDRELALAIRHIREHACEGLHVDELLRATGIARRSLERGTRKLLRRSPKQEIVRVQIETAKQLLLSSNLTAADIAKKCGFHEAQYFSHVFHNKVGVPPAKFRKQNKDQR